MEKKNDSDEWTPKTQKEYDEWQLKKYQELTDEKNTLEQKNQMTDQEKTANPEIGEDDEAWPYMLKKSETYNHEKYDWERRTYNDDSVDYRIIDNDIEGMHNDIAFIKSKNLILKLDKGWNAVLQLRHIDGHTKEIPDLDLFEALDKGEQHADKYFERKKMRSEIGQEIQSNIGTQNKDKNRDLER